MSLIAARLNDLITDAKDDLDHDRVREITAVLRCTGRYGTEQEAARAAADVLAVGVVLSGPDGDNARYLSGQS